MSCCTKISLCPRGLQGSQGPQGKMGDPGNNAKSTTALIPYSSGSSMLIRVNPNGGITDDSIAIMQGLSIPISYNAMDKYNIRDPQSSGISFISPSNGKITKLSIQCVAFNEEDSSFRNIIDMPDDAILTLIFKLYVTSGISDYNLKPITSSVIIFDQQGPYNPGDKIGHKSLDLDVDINAGSQISLISYSKLNGKLEQNANNIGQFIVVGGMDITQDL